MGRVQLPGPEPSSRKKNWELREFRLIKSHDAVKPKNKKKAAKCECVGWRKQSCVDHLKGGWRKENGGVICEGPSGNSQVGGAGSVVASLTSLPPPLQRGRGGGGGCAETEGDRD